MYTTYSEKQCIVFHEPVNYWQFYVSFSLSTVLLWHLNTKLWTKPVKEYIYVLTRWRIMVRGMVSGRESFSLGLTGFRVKVFIWGGRKRYAKFVEIWYTLRMLFFIINLRGRGIPCRNFWSNKGLFTLNRFLVTLHVHFLVGAMAWGAKAQWHRLEAVRHSSETNRMKLQWNFTVKCWRN